MGKGVLATPKFFVNKIKNTGSRAVPVVSLNYRGADKFLARPDWKNNFSSDAEFIVAAETWLDGQYSEFFVLSGLQKLEFGRCSLFLSWLG